MFNFVLREFMKTAWLVLALSAPTLMPGVFTHAAITTPLPEGRKA